MGCLMLVFTVSARRVWGGSADESGIIGSALLPCALLMRMKCVVGDGWPPPRAVYYGTCIF